MHLNGAFFVNVWSLGYSVIWNGKDSCYFEDLRQGLKLSSKEIDAFVQKGRQ